MPIDFNDNTPTPPAGKTNVKWQTDAEGNISAYVDPGTDVGGDMSAAGKVPITQGDGTAVWGDPLVQGTKAEGAAIDNPVTIGGKDGSGNNKALVLDASGRPTVNVNGTVPVSGAISFTAPQHVIVDTAPSTAVTVAALPVGHNIIDSGAVTATVSGTVAVSGVSGDVTVKNVSGNKLAVTADPVTFASPQHVVVDTAPSTAVTIASLPVGHNVIDSGAVTATVSGTVAVSSLPVGHNVIDSGAVTATLAAETSKVIGTVNVAGSQTIGLAAGAAVIGHVIVDTAPSTAVTIASLPVGHNIIDSGAVTATLAAETSKVIGTVNIAGSQTIAVTNATPASLKVDPSGVTSPVANVPLTSGGLSVYNGSVSGTKIAVKASAGQLYGYHILNTTAAFCYVQCWDLASASVTVGTTAPTFVLGLPASGGAVLMGEIGVPFATALTIACTTVRDGAVGAACEVTLFYK